MNIDNLQNENNKTPSFCNLKDSIIQKLVKFLGKLVGTTQFTQNDESNLELKNEVVNLIADLSYFSNFIVESIKEKQVINKNTSMFIDSQPLSKVNDLIYSVDNFTINSKENVINSKNSDIYMVDRKNMKASQCKIEYNNVLSLDNNVKTNSINNNKNIVSNDEQYDDMILNISHIKREAEKLDKENETDNLFCKNSEYEQTDLRSHLLSNNSDKNSEDEDSADVTFTGWIEKNNNQELANLYESEIMSFREFRKRNKKLLKDSSIIDNNIISKTSTKENDKSDDNIENTIIYAAHK